MKNFEKYIELIAKAIHFRNECYPCPVSDCINDKNHCPEVFKKWALSEVDSEKMNVIEENKSNSKDDYLQCIVDTLSNLYDWAHEGAALILFDYLYNEIKLYSKEQIIQVCNKEQLESINALFDLDNINNKICPHVQEKRGFNVGKKENLIADLKDYENNITVSVEFIKDALKKHGVWEILENKKGCASEDVIYMLDNLGETVKKALIIFSELYKEVNAV